MQKRSSADFFCDCRCSTRMAKAWQSKRANPDFTVSRAHCDGIRGYRREPDGPQRIHDLAVLVKAAPRVGCGVWRQPTSQRQTVWTLNEVDRH
ncbi:hypothetical protein [Lysobacter capsici]|uniref:hypothetical protein n=1 Tax=Lysobacter capsici TaxID=435897 RepID=UPI0012FD23B5|nr:hypothetical protein [Lysobacter capsici]